MKRIFLSVMFMMFISINAQTTYGLKGGLSFSNINAGATNINETTRTGTFLSFLTDIKLSRTFHLQPELEFSTAGAKELNVNSINIPLMLKIYANKRIAFLGGPQFGFITSSNIPDEFAKTFNLGFNFGAAYEMKDGLFFEARYNLGVSSIAESNYGDIKTRGFQIGAGYRF